MSFTNITDIDTALNSDNVTIRDLYTIYDQRLPVSEIAQRSAGAASAQAVQIAWMQGDVTRAKTFTRRALEKEEFLLVCDAAREALRHFTEHDDNVRTELVRIRIDYATALARLGFARDARQELEPCISDDFQPRLGRKLKADILLRLGNILSDESQQATARAFKLQTARTALDFYKRSLQLDPERLDTLSLTAATSLALGEPGTELRNQAHETARRILQITEKLEDTDGPRLQTTRARAAACAVLGDVDNAALTYAEMKKMDGVTTADLADARYKAQFLAEALGKPRDFFKAAFPPLQLVVFVGHLPDLPGRAPRFRHDQVERVRQDIREKLAERDVRVGLVSAAAGADLLFVEELLERKGAVHLVLPWSRNEFRRTSIQPYEPAGAAFWEPLFDRALKDAATVREIGQVYEPNNDVGWRYMMEVTAGLALHTARASRLDAEPMALWDGLPGWGTGGTASFVEFWRGELLQDPLIIDLPAPRPDPAASAGAGSWAQVRRTGAKRNARIEFSTMYHEVKSMLFADIVGYSKLSECVIPDFVETFMTRVSQLVASSKHAPRSINTWGDAIYAIFDFARDAGSFALELTQMIVEGEKEWLQKGLYWEESRGENQEPAKRPLNIRVGLHTGPVFRHYDPVVRQLGFTGAHVSRAARIEPVAKPGEVFASEEFTALAELDAEIRRRKNGEREEESDSGFVCEFAGTMRLAKAYPGRFRIYRVLPKRLFVIEELAKAAHELYCVESNVRGETSATNFAMRPWEALTEDLRDANRAQVADIPHKLRALGYELAVAYGLVASEINMSDEQVEKLAVKEHDRWMKDRLDHGWTFAAKRDNGRKHHPLLVPWEQLSEMEKQKDRDTVRNLPRLIEKAGFRVRQIAAAP